MPKLIDLTGKKFERLTVIKRAKENTSDNKPRWDCKCDCGNEVTVAGSHLRNGHTKSCGCLQKEAARNNNYKDITGQTFGNLIALKDVGSNEKGNSLWKCKCACGNEVIVKGIDLRNGHTKSCGCVKSLGEQKIISILNANNIFYKNEYSFENCRFSESKALARFDFAILNENNEVLYLIEYDGKQHFDINSTWNNDCSQFLKTVERDKFKNNYCKTHNIPLIRIPYTAYEILCIEDLILEKSKYRVV